MPVKRGKNICEDVSEKPFIFVPDVTCANNDPLKVNPDEAACNDKPDPCKLRCGENDAEMPEKHYSPFPQWREHNEKLLKQSIRGFQMSTA